MNKKYFIITYGCQMNKSDSERIAALLEKQGHSPALNEQGADLIVINMCSVRQSAVDRVHAKIKKISLQNLTIVRFCNAPIKQELKIILTGCVLDADKKKFKEFGAQIKQFEELENIKPQVKRSTFSSVERGFVPIMRGCNNFCSYCVVPYTRGREKYRAKKNIICEVKHLIEKNIKEITLLGQNVNSYPNFVKLLQNITALPENFKITFITNHPNDFSDELIDEVANNPKIIKYIHLPIQSGDNEILRKMNRNYTREQYLEIIKKIRSKIPAAEITTDIIVGFPGETKKQFQNTVDLVKKLGFTTAYIAKYSPRKGTAAYNLKDNVLPQEKKKREALLRATLI